MDFKFLKSPWVLIGGVGLGVLILTMRGGSGSAASGNGGTDYNRASLDLVALQSQLSADVQKARIEAGGSMAIEIGNQMVNLVNASYAHDLGVKQTDAGVRTTSIAANAAYSIEKLAAATRAKEIAAGLTSNIIAVKAQSAGHAKQTKAQIALQGQNFASIFRSLLKAG